MKYSPAQSLRGRRLMHIGLLLGCATLFGTSVAAQELKWRKYTNERFGFALSYPKTLVAGPGVYDRSE